MQLKYYHAIFELRAKNCPGEFWESLLTKLKVVLAIYGHSLLDPDDSHQLHCIFEDDPSSRSYNNLPYEFKVRAKYFRPVKQVIPYAVHLKLVLLDEQDLSIADYT